MGISTILLILVILLLIGAVPAWPHSRGWGYGPSGLLGVVLVILIILVHGVLIAVLLSRDLALALAVGLCVNVHLVLLEELLDGLHGSGLAGLLALGGVAGARGGLVVLGVVVLAVLTSKHALHLVGIEVLRVVLGVVVVLDDEAWVARQVAHGVPEFAARLFLGSFEASRRGEFDVVDPTLARLVGRTPLTVADSLAAS